MKICSIKDCNSQSLTRTWCSAHYHRYQRYGDPLGKPQLKPKKAKVKCSIGNCWRQAVCRSWCQAHYVRWKTKGDPLESIDIIDGTQPISRYRTITMKNHPLANAEGRVKQHRYVLYESIGSGWHKCFWCDTLVTWDLLHPYSRLALTVDHLNHERSDNRLENLVVSCSRCNSHRWKLNSEEVVWG